MKRPPMRRFPNVTKARGLNGLCTFISDRPEVHFHFKNVGLWEDFFVREELGGVDTGVDLVAVTVGSDYWAVQCKCYLETSTIDKPDVDTFLSTSGRFFHTLPGNRRTLRCAFGFPQRIS